MHHLIQHGKIRSQVINVPKGFPELLSDITREVLRCQPTTECLCQFVIDYLNSLIEARDKARIAKSIIDRSLRIVDEIIADMCICDIPKTKSDQLCEAMEECFRRFLAQRRCEKGRQKEIIKFNSIDMLDELIKKCKFSDDELNISKPFVEDAYQKFVDAYMSAKENTGGTESLYQYFREREIKRMEERLRAAAATKIQANFRGFILRKSLFMDKISETTSSKAWRTEDLIQKEIATRKIQRYYRRHIRVAKQNIKQVSQTAFSVDQIDLKQHNAHEDEYHQEKEPKHLEKPEHNNDHHEDVTTTEEVIDFPNNNLEQAHINEEEHKQEQLHHNEDPHSNPKDYSEDTETKENSIENAVEKHSDKELSHDDKPEDGGYNEKDHENNFIREEINIDELTDHDKTQY